MDAHDLHHNVLPKEVIASQTVGTTGTGRTGKVLDLTGFGGALFLINYGSVTATNAVFTPTMMEGDATGALTSVADADMVNTELLAGLAAAATRTSGVSKNVVKSIGYKGNKQYVSLNLKSTVTAAAVVAVSGLLFNPRHKPAQ